MPGCRIDTLDGPPSIYQEILLSYRLLFGQSSRSRQLLSGLLSSKSKEQLSSMGDEPIDQLLELLCTKALYSRRKFLGLPLGRRLGPHIRADLFPTSALDVYGEILESDGYSAQDDFPVFGQRLLALQRYNKRRQPTKITDLWRDRRNPLQWYTFWVVTFIGGTGILLALLQLLVGFVQMAYAITPAQ